MTAGRCLVYNERVTTAATPPATSTPFIGFIPGVPEPAGSPVIIHVRGHPAIKWQKGPKWTKAIRDFLAAEISVGRRPIFAGPVAVILEFYLLKPKRPLFADMPGTPPDIDKLVRAVLDGFTLQEGGRTLPLLIENDSRVVTLHANKHWANELGQGMRFEVRSIRRMAAGRE